MRLYKLKRSKIEIIDLDTYSIFIVRKCFNDFILMISDGFILIIETRKVFLDLLSLIKI